jgi:ATP-binding cassette subfamily F protein 3
MGDRALEPITHFSGGEKARLALAIIAWQKPNLLLLDEPTNHLDLEMRHALTLALQDFSGAVIVISHDRHLLKNTVDEFLLVDAGKVTPFDGDLHDYERWVVSRAKPEDSPAPAAGQDVGQVKADKRQSRQAAAAKREKLQPVTKKIKQLDRTMTALNEALSQIESQLSDANLYSADGDADLLQALLREQGELRAKLASAEEEWLEHSELLEALTGQD